MMTRVQFENLASMHQFPKKELCDWDQPMQDILVKAYVDSLPRGQKDEIMHEARVDMQCEMINDYCPYAQAECVYDAYKLYYGNTEKLTAMYRAAIYDIVEQPLSEIVEVFFKLGDEPDYAGY